MIKNGYTLENQWWNFIETTHEKVTPTHTALYFYLIHLNNLLNWCDDFGVPTDRTMYMIRLNTYRTYKRTLDDLIKWGFIILVEKSHNQYSCNRIALIIKREKDENASALKSKAKSKAKANAEINTDPSGMDLKLRAEQAYKNSTKKKTNKHIRKEFQTPALEDVLKYFDENDYTSDGATKAYMYYSLAEWHDSKGNPVLNWKQKMYTNWFRPEYKKKLTTLA